MHILLIEPFILEKSNIVGALNVGTQCSATHAAVRL